MRPGDRLRRRLTQALSASTNTEVNMIIHHYEKHEHFYVYSEDRPDISREDAEKGHMIPAGATHIVPPLNQCKKDEIPVYKNGIWKIVKDNFWRPVIEEVIYSSKRLNKAYKPIDFSLNDFPQYPSLPQLCNSISVVRRIIQTIRLINKKFDSCINMHKLFISGYGQCTIESQIPGLLTSSPTIIDECKMESESIIFLMRRILDSLVQLTELLVNYDKFERSKKIKFDSIGKILHEKSRNTDVGKIILGGDSFKSDSTNFISITNDLFNGYKHTLINDESFRVFGEESLLFVGYSVKHSNHSDLIQYHIHDAHQVMMGFQDCIERIIKNQKSYIELISA